MADVCIEWSVKISVVWDVNAFEEPAASVLLVGHEDGGSTLAGQERAHRSIYGVIPDVVQCFSRNSGHANYPTTPTWFMQSERVCCRSATFVVGWAIQDVSKVHSVFVFKVHVPFLLEVGGNTILRNVGCHSPNDTMSDLRRLESAQRWHLKLAVCYEPDILELPGVWTCPSSSIRNWAPVAPSGRLGYGGRSEVRFAASGEEIVLQTPGPALGSAQSPLRWVPFFFFFLRG